jgi:uncharacterized protein YdbL (DUF1318 family)
MNFHSFTDRHDVAGKGRMMKRFVLTAVAAFVFVQTGVCIAQSVQAAKSRMTVRLDVLGKLKMQKQVGENNRGFVEVLDAELSDEMKEVVADENADRRIVYEHVAKGTYATAAMVGIERARQIAERSVPGIMLQDQDGNWSEKQPTPDTE